MASNEQQATTDVLKSGTQFGNPLGLLRDHITGMRDRSNAAGAKYANEEPMEWGDWLAMLEPALLVGLGAGGLARQSGKVAADVIANSTARRAAKTAFEAETRGIPMEHIMPPLERFMRYRARRAVEAETLGKVGAPLAGAGAGVTQLPTRESISNYQQGKK